MSQASGPGTSTANASAHMVTRCPKCSTAFRITNAQLALANGAVRCGSCLHIFKATEYLVKSANAETAKKTIPSTAETSLLKPESKPVNFDKSKALADEEDELISDDMDKPKESPGSHYEFDGFLDMTAQPKQTMSLFEREIKFEPEEEAAPEEDESWAENLLDDDEPSRPLIKKAPAAPETSENETIQEQTPVTEQSAASSSTASHTSGLMFSLVDEPTQNENTPQPVPSNEKSTPFEYAEQVDYSQEEDLPKNTTNASEPEFSEEFLRATQTTQKTSTPTDASNEFAESLFADSDSNSKPTEQASTPKSKKPIKSAYKSGGFSVSRAALLMNIIPAPLEFTTRGGKKRLKQKLWSSLTLIASLILFLQLAYFKFDYFGRIEPYRSAYVFVCPLFNCKVPNLIDKTKIVIYDSHSRSHPKTKDALLFEFIMRNDASFEQPFPDVLLSFSTVNDTPVAARLFKPSEYLGGELAGREFIPPKTPVHIEIELKDPGTDAVNYEVTIK